MIFNESNVKVIRENGYLTKYVGKKAPYFPFTIDDFKKNTLILIDYTYPGVTHFYLQGYANRDIYFFGFTSNGAIRLTFNFSNMTIYRNDFKWGT